MPRSLSTHVLVEHVSGRRKRVLRRQLGSLSSNWKRVPEKKRPPAKKAAAEPPAESAPAVAEPPTPASPADPPDTKEE